MSSIRDLKAEICRFLIQSRVCPPGLLPIATFRHPDSEGRRSIREDADVSYFCPEKGDYIRIEFSPAETRVPEQVIPGFGEVRPDRAAPAGADRIIRALDRAEREPGKTFVAIKTFRDSILPREGWDWEQGCIALNSAIGARLVVTGKIANPHRPEFPTTTIQLNRQDPRVRAVLGEPEAGGQASRRFTPVDLGPVSASAVVIQERR